MFSQVAHDTVSAAVMGHLDAVSQTASPCWGWGASTRLVAQAFFPAIQPRPAGPRYPASNLSITHDRGLAGGCAAESPSAGPILGAARSAERGCTGRAGRCSRPGRKFGFRRRRAPSVRHRRHGVCHCASAQPCSHCSPTQAGQTLLGLAIPTGRLAVVASGRLTPARVLSRAVLSAVVGAGLAGRGPKGSAPPGPTRGRLPGQPRSAGRSRSAGVPASRRVARPSIRAREVAWP
jgi:hypothetical protein